MNILIYHPANHPAKDLESLMEAFLKKGYGVFLLTHDKKGLLHESVSKIGVKTFTTNISGKFYYLKHFLFLINFCKKNKITIGYSNLQQCSLIAIFAQFFSKTKFTTWRHHSDSVYLYGNKKEKITDWLINKLSKQIITISNYSYNQIIQKEKVNKSKVNLIQLGYNFQLFVKPNLDEAHKIRQQFNCELLIIIVGRLIPLKRVDIAIQAIENLVHKNLNIKLLVLGSGKLESELKGLISQKKMNENIFLLGHKTNIEDYIEAADILIHTSYSEASSHMPKEAGFLNKSLIACENVGDFSDYIITPINGILINKKNTLNELIEQIEKLYLNKNLVKKMGNELHSTIINNFHINNIITKHENLIQKLNAK